MGRPYSMDMRNRCVAAVEGGQSCHSVAARFGVGVSSVIRWVQLYRQTGSAKPGQMGGHRPYVLEEHSAFITGQLQQTPHMSMEQLRSLLAARGVEVSHDTVWRFVRRQGLRFKKNASGS